MQLSLKTKRRAVQRTPVCTLVLSAVALTCLPPLAGAQASLPATVVVANRVEQPLTDVVADVSIIDRAQIEASGASVLADVLATLPGIEFARNGGVGQATSVFVRGAESRFVAVFIDGVRIDSQSTGGATWQAIPLAQIERVEVVRGPAAAVYGSDALGGVVHIVTRRAEGPWQNSVEVGLGNDGLRRAQAALAGRAGDWDWALGAHAERGDGFNVNQTAGANPDRDGHRSRSASVKLGWQADARHRLEATALAHQLDAEYDAYASTAEDWSNHTLRTVGLQWQARWSDTYRSRLSVGRGTDRYETRPSPYLAETEVTTWLWSHDWWLGAHRWQAALERREDVLRNSSLTGGVQQRHQNALALGWGWQQGVHTLQVNVRHDDDSEFGGQSSGALAYAFGVAPGWRARAGVGTAFRAPTLFQRFSEYGRPTLQPERARNAEVGLQYVRAGVEGSATLYRTAVRNLIVFGAAGPCASPWGCYENAGRATLRGLTLAGALPLGPGRLAGSIEWSDPINADTGKRLPRRAARAVKLRWEQPVAQARLGLEWQAWGERYDNASNTRRLGGYGVLNLSWRQPLARDWALLARLDNVGNKDYQTAWGYPTGGRRAFVGVTWTPR